KARSALVNGAVRLVVWANSLSGDPALLVSGLLVDGGVGPMMLVVSDRDFEVHAELSTWDGRPVYSMGFGMNPHANSRWLPFLVPTEHLSERFGVGPAEASTAAAAPGPSSVWRSDLGFLGESEV